MKRIVFSALALSLLAVPMAEAQTRSGWGQDQRVESQHRPGAANGQSYRKPIARQHRYERGQRFAGWKRHQAVRDWKRHGLRKPGRGQQWVRVGKDYMLIAITSGIIAGLIAGR